MQNKALENKRNTKMIWSKGFWGPPPGTSSKETEHISRVDSHRLTSWELDEFSKPEKSMIKSRFRQRTMTFLMTRFRICWITIPIKSRVPRVEIFADHQQSLGYLLREIQTTVSGFIHRENKCSLQVAQDFTCSV